MNIRNSQKQTAMKGALIALAASAALPQIAHADMVYLNNQPLATSVAPIQRNGRTLVPMRDIFEALGAQVTYNPATQSVRGVRGTTTVNLKMGSRTAYVNQQPVTLETAPSIYNGRTLVPLRFVSESLGARVGYDAQRLIVSVTTNGSAPVYAQNPGSGSGSGSQVAGSRTISVPSGVVVPVTLDSALSSATARKGDRFSATVSSDKAGDSEFPAGTRLEGVVRDAAPKNGDNPGVLDLDFRAAVLPDGTRYPLQAQLVDLSDAKQVNDNGRGRMTAGSNGKDSKDRLKVIGIGAAAGYGLGKVLLKKNGALSAILGGAAGYFYDKKSNKKVREAQLDAGTKLGVRLDQTVTYADYDNYGNARRTYTTS